MLSNIWYAVLVSSELSKDAPRQIVLGMETYVLYRDRFGAVKAIADVCSHQGASLAGGKIKDDCISCPYHAWHFNGDGRCISKPADPDSPIRERDHLVAHAVLEQDGFIWLFIGDAALAKNSTPPKLVYEGDTSFHSLSGIFKFRAHLHRVMLNGTDVAHVPFVHPSQFGNALLPATPRYKLHYHEGGASAALVSVAPGTPEQLLLSKLALNGDMTAVATAYFFMPNVTALKVVRGGKTVLLISAHVPIGDDQSNQTETHWIFQRNFLRSGVLDGIFRRSMKDVFEVDAAIICEQTPQALTLEMLQGATNAQLSDSLGIYYRKLLREALQHQKNILE